MLTASENFYVYSCVHMRLMIPSLSDTQLSHTPAFLKFLHRQELNSEPFTGEGERFYMLKWTSVFIFMFKCREGFFKYFVNI